jgi:hypothetical protein
MRLIAIGAVALQMNTCSVEPPPPISPVQLNQPFSELMTEPDQFPMIAPCFGDDPKGKTKAEKEEDARRIVRCRSEFLTKLKLLDQKKSGQIIGLQRYVLVVTK